MYKPTIGLEIHAELKTKSKMFCGCLNDPEAKPNTNICPICTANPGTLPTINKQAVLSVLRVGVALGGRLADFSEFDRKNYFYPDIPKGYQISQYKYPLISGGEINCIQITRIHLEEDTGTSSHDKGDFSLVNFNRAGVPLMELVTEPVIKSAKEASDFAKELQLVLRYLGVSNANMEKGEMRVEANVSVSKTEKFGVKTEVKNLNSFKSVERAIEYEIKRQIEVLESGGEVIQETRGFDEDRGETFSQRKKEESHDYRYFPEPDLPKLELSKLDWAKREEIEKSLPELPKEKRERFEKSFGIKNEDVEVYINDSKLGEFFEDVAGGLKSQKLISLASNYITSDVLGLSKGDGVGKISSQNIIDLVQEIDVGNLSSRGAKDVLKKIFTEGGNVKDVANELGVIQVNDTQRIKEIIENVLVMNSGVVADYKGGKESSLQFLIGQIMKEGKGAFNPQIVKEELLNSLK